MSFKYPLTILIKIIPNTIGDNKINKDNKESIGLTIPQIYKKRATFNSSLRVTLFELIRTNLYNRRIV